MKQKLYAIYNKEHKCLISHKITWETNDGRSHFVPVIFDSFAEATKYLWEGMEIREVNIIDNKNRRYYNVRKD